MHVITIDILLDAVQLNVALVPGKAGLLSVMMIVLCDRSTGTLHVTVNKIKTQRYVVCYQLPDFSP